MSRRDRTRMQPRMSDELESRRLLSAPQVPGNVGQVLSSQFQPDGFTTVVGTQFRGVKLRGELKIDVVNPFPITGVSESAPEPGPANSGLIANSQFNGGGFRTVGLQFDHVSVGGALTVSGFDNENTNVPGIPSTTINANLIENSQFSDGGFGILTFNPDGTRMTVEGRVGLQWLNTNVRGPVNVGLEDLVIEPGANPTPAVLSVTPAVASVAPAISSVTAAVSTDATGPIPFQSKVEDRRTNIGKIKNSQFNDGGFGDIGMQWMDVSVGAHVGTSTNTLFIKPQQNDLGPITIQNLVFGQSNLGAAAATQRAASAAPAAAAATSDVAPASPHVRLARTHPLARSLAKKPAGKSVHVSLSATDQVPVLDTAYRNAATNSGKLIGSQMNDGGFGDVGLQWRRVHVGGSVSAVHNSLTVQPENTGQGLITVQGISFPNAPPAPPRPERKPSHVLPPDPAVIASDGNSVELPPATGPRSPFFSIPFSGAGTVTYPYPGDYFPLENAASNSGLVRGGQTSDGGFGDEGLQWQKVRVGGNVQIVHNSLSVQPEGSMLAGINVANVNFGPPVSRRVARHLKVIKYAQLSPGVLSGTAASTFTPDAKVLNPPNDRYVANQQFASAGGTDVFLQWNGIEHNRGLVIVHNIILLTNVGPNTGPITLENVRFPFKLPTFAPLVTVLPAASVSAQPLAASTSDHARAGSANNHAGRASAKEDRQDKVLLNSADNSGILSHAQFSDGGFGDEGLQWRNVSVSGSVAVVHNTLSVNESPDNLAPGEIPGPINISNITFNNGALGGDLSTKHNQFIVYPPKLQQRKSTHPVNLGKPLRAFPGVRENGVPNTGVLAGGQLTAGGANHALLQFQCVKLNGKVVVMDNVLSISMQDIPTAPVTISNVTFA